MKKNNMIDLLSKIEGNPDILLWNGIVGDWVDFDKTLVEQLLVKQTLSHYLETLRWERCRDTKDFEYQLTPEEIEKAKRYHKEHSDWAMNDYATQEDIESKRYITKKVFFINAKNRGETYYDRCGSLKY